VPASEQAQGNSTVKFTSGQAKLFEEAYGVALEALGDPACQKAVAGMNLDAIALARNPSGNLEQLHDGFVYGGSGILTDAQGKPTGGLELGRATLSGVTLFAGFFDAKVQHDNGLRLGAMSSGPMKNIEIPQLRAGIILHELRHKINLGRAGYHENQDESDRWSREILSACFTGRAKK
jgi:hypothetical protein